MISPWFLRRLDRVRCGIDDLRSVADLTEHFV